MGKLTVVYGPMFAGKTTWLIRKIRELEKMGQKCLVFKPRLDDRYGKESKLHTHDGLKHETVLVDEKRPTQILEKWVEHSGDYKVVAIDEVMFFPNDIIQVVKEFIARDIDVIVSGLDTNFRREGFGVMPYLIKQASEKEELHSICYKCGGVAKYSARLAGGDSEVEVGSDDIYQPACLECHTICDELSKKNILPDLRKRKRGLPIRIEVGADSMRVGKTTAVKVIAEGLRKNGFAVTESYEDWQHNPYLKKSYEDPSHNFLESQKWFIKRKWEQIVSGTKVKGVFIQDVSPETDYCYAVTNLRLGRMSQANFDKYDKYFRSLSWKSAPKPDLLIYLEVGDNALIKRAHESRRKFETVEEDYFLMMKRVNREWLESLTDKSNLLVINTDDFDFANDKNAKKMLVDKVLVALKLRENIIGIL